MRGSHGLSWDERLSNVWEKFWKCTIKRNHMVKMDSHGCCYRCGRKVERYL